MYEERRAMEGLGRVALVAVLSDYFHHEGYARAGKN